MNDWTTTKILLNINSYLKRMEQHKGKYDKRYANLSIREVSSDLGIFDWYTDTLSYSRLKEMKQFIETVQKYGFYGYVCFKVGSAGTTHGMWAYRSESTNGYSPDGICIYRSFSTENKVYWRIEDKKGQWHPDSDNYNTIHTKSDLDKLIKDLKDKNLI